MNALAKIHDQAPVTDLVIIPAETALSVLTQPEEFDAFYLRVKAIVDAHVPDVTTAKGREAIKALAFKVVKSKTAIDAAGKALTEEWRTQTAKVDTARKAIRDKLDALRDEARRPVTEWEAAEEQRVTACEGALAQFKAAGVVAMGETAAEVSGRLADLEAERVDEATFQELAPIAAAALEGARNALRSAVDRLTQEEADRAELERLRAANAEREARETAEAAERQRQEQEAAAACRREEAEAQRLQVEEQRRAREAEAQAERERQAATRAAQEAEERVRAEERQRAQTAAAEERRRADEERQAQEAKLADERRQRAAAEAESLRLQQEAEARQREVEERLAAERRRQADRDHRGKIMGAAKTAIMAAGGVGEEAAKKIVLAIGAGEIPAVSLAY